MKKLYRYIVKSFLGTFLFTFFIVIFILLMQFLWLYIDDMVGKGLETSILLELFFYMSITFVPMALPLALLLASLMCFGNFGEHYELVAMKASGISIWRVMRPLMFFSLFLSGIAFVFSNSIIPVATLKAKTLLFDVRKQKLAFDIKEGVYYRDIEDYVIYISKKGDDGSHIYGVKIYNHTDREGNTKIMSADSGMMALSPNQRNIVFTLYNGYNYTDVTTNDDFKIKRPFERMSFKEEQIKFSLADFDMTRSSEEIYKSYHEMMNIHQLSTALDSLEIRYNERQQLFTESFGNRFSNYKTRQADTCLINRDSLAADTTTLLRWPLIENIDPIRKAKVMEMAVGGAQNAKDNVNFNSIDFKSQVENIRKHRKQWHKKFTLSIACLIFFFIGAPLGTIIRKGGLGLPTVISVLFFVVYWVTSTIGERVAVTGGLNMFLGVWLSSLILFPVGVFLTFKATSDSALLDADSWRNAFKKLKHHIFKTQKT
ncbi:MAG: LptF/LptG family permease [Bacteroidales bacterium]|nr:LptF/LptG family permease [Bacteroidales bacterium]